MGYYEDFGVTIAKPYAQEFVMFLQDHEGEIPKPSEAYENGEAVILFWRFVKYRNNGPREQIMEFLQNLESDYCEDLFSMAILGEGGAYEEWGSFTNYTDLTLDCSEKSIDVSNFFAMADVRSSSRKAVKPVRKPTKAKKTVKRVNE